MTLLGLVPFMTFVAFAAWFGAYAFRIGDGFSWFMTFFFMYFAVREWQEFWGLKEDTEK